MRKRIVFVIPTLTGGGAERVIVTLLKHLDRSRFELTLAVVDTRDAALRDEIPADVTFLDLGAGRVRYALPKIIALIRRRRPDVVFSTLGHLNVALAIVRFLLPRSVRTVARETTVVSNSLQQQPHRGFWQALYRWFYRWHDEVICQSRYMRDDLVKNFDFPESKTRVINNPVDVEHVRKLAAQPAVMPVLAAGAVRLVAAGRLDPEKGFDLLIDALKLLNHPSVHLFLLGKGLLAAELERHAAQSGIGDRVHFVGFQANPFAWYAQADAFVLSSRYEGFPNAMLEALACGTPVIALPAPGGTREILDGVDGCMIAEQLSAGALAQAIERWLNGSRTRVAESVADLYRVERIVREYEAALWQEARA